MEQNIFLSTLCVILLSICAAEREPSEILSRTQIHNIDIHDNIYTLNLDGANLKITSNGITVCDIFVDSNKLQILEKMRASAMGNGKIIVWGQQNEEQSSYSVKKVKNTSHLFMIINMQNCTYEALPEFEDQTPFHWPDTIEANVVTYEDTFDIFLPSQKKCFPCRFNDWGDSIPLKRSFPLIAGVPSRTSHIHAFLDSEHEVRGYFFAYNLKSGNTVVKLLKPDFQVLEKGYLHHPVDVASINYRWSTLIGLCYKRVRNTDESTKEEIVCVSLDSLLKPIWTVVLPLIPGCSALGFDLKVDQYGYLHVAVVESKTRHKSFEGNSIHIKFYHLNRRTGDIIHEAHSEFHRHYLNMQPYFRKNNKFCVVINLKNMDSSGISTMTECVTH